MSGYVWGANVGWISLSNAEAHVQTTLASGPDSDGDGIPDDWEYKQVENLTDLSDGEDDYDGDGVPDSGEYATDTDPDNASEYLAITEYTAASGGTNDITWMVTRPTRFYQLECCDMLSKGSGWDDSGLGVMAPDSGDTMTREVTINTTSQFFRVKGVVPLSP